MKGLPNLRFYFPIQQALCIEQHEPPLQQSAFLVVLLFPAFTILPNAISTVSAVKITFFII